MFNNEKKQILNNFFERTFFASWNGTRKNANYDKIELIVTADCVLKCDYCYYKDYGNITYPKYLRKQDKILKNLDLLLDWLETNKYFPIFDIFSGDFFNLPYSFTILDKLIDFQYRNNITNDIVIPTGMSFIGNEELENKILEYIDNAKSKGIYIALSASIDGKYCDDNRPFRIKNSNTRDDAWYDRCFSFCKKTSTAFHPMVYYKYIDKWKDNWDWFQTMFKKHNMNWFNIYLLEVRNDGWDLNAIQEFEKFWEYVVSDILNRYNKSASDVFDLIIKRQHPHCNTLSMLFKCGRGMPCSIQSDFSVRLGDLKIVPCHRMAYDQYNYGEFVVENDKITEINPLNVSMLVSVQSINISNSPKCEICLMKSMCAGGCLGSQYENTGDPFIPINSVCALEHAKVFATLKAMNKFGLLDLILSNKELFLKDKCDTMSIIKERYFKDVEK